jgi:hypothetical protein
VVSVGVRANLILGDGACGGLSLGLIHGRTRTSIDVHGGVSSCQNDGHDLSRTVFPAPEKRKVGGSTPPLTTTIDLREIALTCGYVAHALPLAMRLNAGRSGLLRLSAPNTRPSCRSPLAAVIIVVIAKRFVYPSPGYRIVAVNTLGVDLEQDGNSAPGSAILRTK